MKKKIFKGKFFRASMVDDALELSPMFPLFTSDAYVLSEAKAMKKELSEVIKLVKVYKK